MIDPAQLFSNLQEELERFEHVEERIEKLSFEILQCKNQIIYLNESMKNLSITKLELTTKDLKIDDKIHNLYKDDFKIKKQHAR